MYNTAPTFTMYQNVLGSAMNSTERLRLTFMSQLCTALLIHVYNVEIRQLSYFTGLMNMIEMNCVKFSSVKHHLRLARPEMFSEKLRDDIPLLQFKRQLHVTSVLWWLSLLPA